MEETMLSNSQNQKIQHRGKKELVSSFIAANVVEHGFEKFRVPLSFNIEFGLALPRCIKLYCNVFEWDAKYDKESRMVYGMRRFIKFFGVKIYQLLQFDYYGEDFFVVRIFKETAVETDYQTMDMEKFLNIPYIPNWKRDQYVLDTKTLEYDKACALWLFNAYRNYANYFEMKMSGMDIDPNLAKLKLQTGLENFYNNWKDGDTIILMFINRGWEIQIERKAENCDFVNGWMDFVKETELESGDTLVFYKLNDSEDNTIQICIFKAGNDHTNNRKDDVEWNISFLKVISVSSMNEGMLVVPKVFKETYGDIMSSVNKIEVAGHQRFLFYSFIGGYLENIFQILNLFNVRPKETVIFTMDNTTVLHGRVYQEDGREIDYSNRLQGCSISKGTDWMWSIHWNNETEVAESEYMNQGRDKLKDSTSMLESDAEMKEVALVNIVEDEAVELENNDADMAFSSVMTKCNVNGTSHGAYIPRHINPHNRKWKSGERVSFRSEDRVWTIGVTYSNGLARFSAGWNRFAKDNEVKMNETLVFNMLEGEGGLSFDIDFPGRG